MTRRRRPSLAVRCLQGLATPLLLAAVAFGLHWVLTLVFGRR